MRVSLLRDAEGLLRAGGVEYLTEPVVHLLVLGLDPAEPLPDAAEEEAEAQTEVGRDESEDQDIDDVSPEGTVGSGSIGNALELVDQADQNGDDQVHEDDHAELVLDLLAELLEVHQEDEEEVGQEVDSRDDEGGGHGCSRGTSYKCM